MAEYDLTRKINEEKAGSIPARLPRSGETGGGFDSREVRSGEPNGTAGPAVKASAESGAGATINEGGQASASGNAEPTPSGLSPVTPSPDDDLVTLLRDTATDVLDPGYPYYGVPELVRHAASAIERLTADLRAEERGQDNLRRVITDHEATIARLTAEREDVDTEEIVRALRAEVDALRADAERYRWLRIWNRRWEIRHWTGVWWDSLTTDGLDAAIDAERGKGGRRKRKC